jgi:hypothetical protein
MAKHIARYDATWHPDMHRGVIFLQYADGQKGRLDAGDAAEFCALLSVLRQDSPVITSKGWVGSGLEEPE